MMTKKIRPRFKGISILCLVFFFTVGLSGCTATRHAVQRTVVPMLSTSVDDLVEKLIKKKNAAFIKDGLPGALLVITGMVELAPTDYNLLATSSFLYAAYGLFVEDENPDYAISLYRVGAEYGMRAMKVNNSKFRKAVDSGISIADAAKFLTKNDLKALTWYGCNVGKRCTLQFSTPENVMDIQDCVATAKRSTELDPKYAWGANWMILGVFYAVVPAFGGVGSGPEASREAFNNGNKAENGEFGLMDVMQARYLAPRIKNLSWYDQLNNRVIEMDSCKLGGGLCILNELAKQKARYNMKHKDQWFDASNLFF
jgi:hypothetical protein